LSPKTFIVSSQPPDPSDMIKVITNTRTIETFNDELTYLAYSLICHDKNLLTIRTQNENKVNDTKNSKRELFSQVIHSKYGEKYQIETISKLFTNFDTFCLQTKSNPRDSGKTHSTEGSSEYFKGTKHLAIFINHFKLLGTTNGQSNPLLTLHLNDGHFFKILTAFVHFQTFMKIRFSTIANNISQLIAFTENIFDNLINSQNLDLLSSNSKKAKYPKLFEEKGKSITFLRNIGLKTRKNREAHDFLATREELQESKEFLDAQQMNDFVNHCTSFCNHIISSRILEFGNFDSNLINIQQIFQVSVLVCLNHFANGQTPQFARNLNTSFLKIIFDINKHNFQEKLNNLRKIIQLQNETENENENENKNKNEIENKLQETRHVKFLEEGKLLLDLIRKGNKVNYVVTYFVPPEKTTRKGGCQLTLPKNCSLTVIYLALVNERRTPFKDRAFATISQAGDPYPSSKILLNKVGNPITQNTMLNCLTNFVKLYNPELHITWKSLRINIFGNKMNALDEFNVPHSKRIRAIERNTQTNNTSTRMGIKNYGRNLGGRQFKETISNNVRNFNFDSDSSSSVLNQDDASFSKNISYYTKGKQKLSSNYDPSAFPYLVDDDAIDYVVEHVYDHLQPTTENHFVTQFNQNLNKLRTSIILKEKLDTIQFIDIENSTVLVTLSPKDPIFPSIKVFVKMDYDQFKIVASSSHISRTFLGIFKNILSTKKKYNLDVIVQRFNSFTKNYFNIFKFEDDEITKYCKSLLVKKDSHFRLPPLKKIISTGLISIVQNGSTLLNVIEINNSQLEKLEYFNLKENKGTLFSEQHNRLFQFFYPKIISNTLHFGLRKKVQREFLSLVNKSSKSIEGHIDFGNNSNLNEEQDQLKPSLHEQEHSTAIFHYNQTIYSSQNEEQPPFIVSKSPIKSQTKKKEFSKNKDFIVLNLASESEEEQEEQEQEKEQEQEQEQEKEKEQSFNAHFNKFKKINRSNDNSAIESSITESIFDSYEIEPFVKIPNKLNPRGKQILKHFNLLKLNNHQQPNSSTIPLNQYTGRKKQILIDFSLKNKRKSTRESNVTLQEITPKRIKKRDQHSPFKTPSTIRSNHNLSFESSGIEFNSRTNIESQQKHFLLLQQESIFF